LSNQLILRANAAFEVDDRGLALLWLTKALEIDEGDPEREQLHRRRIAQTRERMPTLVGIGTHAARIACLDRSPDDQSLVTGSYDGTAKIWDFRTGRQIGQTLQHAGNVYQAVFSPDGRYVATACGDGTARLWDARTGIPVSVPLVHESALGFVKFNHDGTLLATSSGSPSHFHAPPSGVDISKDKRPPQPVPGETQGAIWEIPSCRPRKLEKPLPGGPIAWDPEGKVLAYRQEGIQFVDAASGEAAGPQLPKPWVVTDLHYADVHHLVVRSNDGTCTVWDLRDRTPRISNVALDSGYFHHPLGRIDDSGAFMIGRETWDLATGRLEKVFGDQRTLGDFTIGDRRYLMQWTDLGLRMYSVADDAVVSPTLGMSSVISFPGGPPVIVSRDRRFVALVDEAMPTMLNIVDLAGLGAPIESAIRNVGGERHPLIERETVPLVVGEAPHGTVRRLSHGARQDGAGVVSVVATSDGKSIITAGGDRRIRFWDARTGAALPPAIELEGDPGELALAEDDAVLLATVRVAGEEYEIQGWSKGDRTRCWPPIPRTYRGAQLAVSPSGRYFSRNSGSHKIEVWDASTGARLFEGTPHAYWVGRPRFSPGEDFVVFPGGDGLVTVWSLPDGRRLHAWPSGDTAIENCAIAHDGRWVAAVGAERVHLWELATGQRHGAAIPGGWGWSSQIHLSADDRTMLLTKRVADKWFRTSLLDLTTGQKLGPSVFHEAESLGGETRFRPDDQSFEIIGDTVQRWPLLDETMSVAELTACAVAITGHDLDESGALAPIPQSRRVQLLSEHLRRFPEDGVVGADRVRSWRLQELHRLLDGRDAAAVSLEAVAILEQLLAENPGDVDLLAYAPILATAGQPARATRLHARRILAVPVDSSEWRQFEASLAESDIQPEIEALADDTLRENPDSAAAYQLKGLATLQRGDAASALELLTKACQLGATGQVHSYRAAAHALRGSWKEAEAEFLVLLADEPNDLPAIRGLMAVRLAVGDAAGWQKAARELHTRPGQGEFWYGPRAAEVTRAFAARPISSGIGFDSKWLVRQVEKLTTAKPGDQETQLALATALFRDGQFERAVAVVTGDAVRDPGPWGLLILAISRQKLGNTAAAQEAHAEAVRRLDAAKTTAGSRDWPTRCELEALASEAATLVPTPASDEQPNTP